MPRLSFNWKNLECPPCFGHGAYGRLYVVCWRQANVEFWSCLLPKIHNSNLNTHTQTYTHCSYLLREKEIQIDLCEYIRITVYIWSHIVCVFKENYKFPNDVLQHKHVRMSDSRKIVVYSLFLGWENNHTKLFQMHDRNNLRYFVGGR